MMKFTINPLTGEYSVEPSFGISDGMELIGRIFRRKDAYLDYSVQHAAKFYGDNQARWVFQDSTLGGRTLLAYELVYDYRSANPAEHSWGTATVKDQFVFPAELVEHRNSMVDRMTKEGRINGSFRIPRVAALQITDKGPALSIEIAEYYDQVGTNLTLDCTLPTPIEVGSTTCRTVREWDRAQACVHGRMLPSFETSRLANSIGVGVGLSARDGNGTKHFIYRYRSSKAPVYPNTWHLPVSFALEIDASVVIGEQYDIATLVRNDFPEELSTETELLRRHFGALSPIAFCRDLTRGGKPQLFFELECNLPLKELLVRIGSSSKEYTKQPRTVPERVTTDALMSPELACFLALSSAV